MSDQTKPRISEEKALEVLQSLRLLKYAPSKTVLLATLLNFLMEICWTDQEADWLIQQVPYLIEWPGVAVLRDMVFKQFRQKPAGGFYAEDKPPIQCSRCGDSGIVVGPQGRFQRCDCEAGPGVPESLLKLGSSGHGGKEVRRPSLDFVKNRMVAPLSRPDGKRLREKIIGKKKTGTDTAESKIWP